MDDFGRKWMKWMGKTIDSRIKKKHQHVSFGSEKNLFLQRSFRKIAANGLNLKSYRERFYIQSVYALPSPEKMEQEVRPFLNINDAFKRIVIVKEDILLRRNDMGIVTMGLREFLVNNNSLYL